MALFGLGRKGTNPADAAMPYLNKIPEMGRQTYNPFIERGERAAQTTEPIFKRLASDPQGVINEMMQAYEPSQAYQFKKGELGQGLSNTAAAGGFRGNPFEQRQQGELINALLSQDMQQWLDNLTQAQGRGLQGLTGEESLGFNASSQLADLLGGTYASQANLAGQQAAARGAKRGGRMGMLGRLGGAALGGALGGMGGAAMGGAPGGGFTGRGTGGAGGFFGDIFSGGATTQAGGRRSGAALGSALGGDIFGQF